MIINIILSLTMRLLYLFTCFMHPQLVTGPPFVREATCITSLHSVHLCIAYAIRLSFLVHFILASHASCLCICVLHASYHDSSQLQSLLMHPSSCGPTDPLPLQKTLVSSSLHHPQSYQSRCQSKSNSDTLLSPIMMEFQSNYHIVQTSRFAQASSD